MLDLLKIFLTVSIGYKLMLRKTRIDYERNLLYNNYTSNTTGIPYYFKTGRTRNII